MEQIQKHDWRRIYGGIGAIIKKCPYCKVTKRTAILYEGFRGTETTYHSEDGKVLKPTPKCIIRQK